MSSHQRRFGGWYAAFFLHDLIPIYPFYAVMFTENGVGPYGLSVLLTVWVTVCIVLEVPSGALADLVSRKRLLVASGLLQACAYLVWLAQPSFPGYLAGFVLWGVSSVLRSGTTEALLYDTLAVSGDTERFAQVYGRITALGSLAGGLAMVLGGLCVRFGFDTVLVLSALSPAVAAVVVAVGIRDAPRAGAVHEAGYFSTLAAGLREAATNRAVLFVVALSATLLSLPGILDEYVGPLLDEKGFLKDWIGYLFGAVFVAQALGNAVGHRLRGASVAGLFGALFLGGVILLASVFGSGAVVVVGLLGCFLLFALATPLIAAHLQESIQSSSRATVTSVNGVAEGVASVAIYQGFGLVSTGYGMGGGTLYIAVIILALCPMFAWWARRLGFGTGPGGA